MGERVEHYVPYNKAADLGRIGPQWAGHSYFWLFLVPRKIRIMQNWDCSNVSTNAKFPLLHLHENIANWELKGIQEYKPPFHALSGGHEVLTQFF